MPQLPKCNSGRKQSVTFADQELQVERSSSNKVLASMVGRVRPSPFQHEADNQQPAPCPFSPTSLPAEGQESHPQHQSDSNMLSSIWPWLRHIRRPARKSKSSLNLSCPQTDPQFGNKDASSAAAKTGQQPTQHPPAVASGRPSQPQKAAVEDTARPPPSPFAQHMSWDQGQPQPEHAAVEGAAQLPPSQPQRVSVDQGQSQPEHAAVEGAAQPSVSPFQHALMQPDCSQAGVEAHRVALHRQLCVAPRKSMSFSAHSPLQYVRPFSHDGVQMHPDVHSSQNLLPMLPGDHARSSAMPTKPMRGRSPAFPLRLADGCSLPGQQSATDAARSARRSTPRLARVMSWKLTKASSLGNQGLGPVEAEAGSLMCHRSSASQASTHCEPLSNRSSLEPSSSDNAGSQGCLMAGLSHESLISQAALFSQGRGYRISSGSITGERPVMTRSLHQGPTSIEPASLS